MGVACKGGPQALEPHFENASQGMGCGGSEEKGEADVAVHDTAEEEEDPGIPVYVFVGPNFKIQFPTNEDHTVAWLIEKTNMVLLEHPAWEAKESKVMHLSSTFAG